MKTSTKGMIAILVAIIAVSAVTIILVAANRSQDISYFEFRESLYAGRYEKVQQSSDVWTATDGGGKKYVANMHNTGNADVNVVVNYKDGLDLAKSLAEKGAAFDTAPQPDENKTAQENQDIKDAWEAGKAEWEASAAVAWGDYTAKTYEKYEIRITNEMSDWAKYPTFKFDQNNRYAASIADFIYPVVMVIFFIVIVVFVFRSMRASGNVASNFGKSKANVSSALKVRFSDVAGAEEEKEELAEIVEFLKSPAKFTNVGARIPRGVLLVGPPGTGKTLFAKAIAGEANVPFFSISGSDFVEMFVGVGASRVRDLFDQAKKNQPCIIFIDEIDAVGRQRGAGLGGGNDEREQTLNQLLVQMDGFETNENVIVVAATNRADILDPALMRPGRFDRQVYINVPDVKGREAIFRVHSRNKPMSQEIDFQVLARMTSGFTGADIANLLNESAILCARAGRTQIIMEDIYEGIDKVVIGTQKKSRLITEVDKRITAYHEGGHAIVAKKLAPYCDPVHEISIIPRGRALGYTMMRPDNDDDHITYKKLTADIAMGMGGRCAEEIVIQDVSAGACGDIKQATELARRMVTEWGMSSDVGPIFYGGSQEVFLGRDYGTSHSYSESTAALIDAEVAKLIKEGHTLATKIISENREILDVVVRVLFEKETIYGDEFDMIMEGKSAEEVIRFIDSRVDRKSSKLPKKSDKVH